MTNPAIPAFEMVNEQTKHAVNAIQAPQNCTRMCSTIEKMCVIILLLEKN